MCSVKAILVRHIFFQTNGNWIDHLLPYSGKNVSISSHLLNLFTNEWLTNVNYSSYVAECAPLFCTYSIREQTNLSYTITLLLSLYGSLTIILRFSARSIVKMASGLANRNFSFGLFSHDETSSSVNWLLFVDL